MSHARTAVVERLATEVIDGTGHGPPPGQGPLALFELLGMKRWLGLSAGANPRSAEDRPVPVVLQVARWLAAARIAAGLAGTVAAVATLSIPRLPFVLVTMVALASTALVLDLAGRDRRTRVLGHVYWSIAAAFSWSGVSFLLRFLQAPEWLSAFDALRPESSLPLALWLFASEFPRSHGSTTLDSVARLAPPVAFALSVLLFLSIGSGLISDAWFQGLVLAAASPAILLIAARWRSATGVEGARVRLFLSSVAAALIPMAVTTAAVIAFPTLDAYLRSSSGLWIGVATAYIPLMLMPVATAYAVASTSVLPIRVMVLAGFRHMLTHRAPLWVAGASGGTLLLIALFGDGAAADVLRTPLGKGSAWTVGVSLAVWLAAPRLNPALEKWEHPAGTSQQAALARLTARLREARTAADVATEAASTISHGLRAPADAYLFRQERLVPVAGGLAPPDDSLIAVLLKDEAPVAVGDGVSRSLFEWLNPADQEWVFVTRTTVVVPIPGGRGTGRVIGCVAAGLPRGGLTLTRRDMEFLTSCADIVALACESMTANLVESDRALEPPALHCTACGRVVEWTEGDRACSCGAARTPAALPKRLSQRFDLLQYLGRGGMGTVYRATDRTLQRDVALTLPCQIH